MARLNVSLDVDECHGDDPDAEAERRREVLEYARRLARRAALRNLARLATIDEVQRRLGHTGHDHAALGNAAGSVFRTAGWRSTPYRLRSRRRSSRGRTLVVWEYVGAKLAPKAPVSGPLGILVEDLAAAVAGLGTLRRRELHAAVIEEILGGAHAWG